MVKMIVYLIIEVIIFTFKDKMLSYMESGIVWFIVLKNVFCEKVDK